MCFGWLQNPPLKKFNKTLILASEANSDPVKMDYFLDHFLTYYEAERQTIQWRIFETIISPSEIPWIWIYGVYFYWDDCDYCHHQHSSLICDQDRDCVRIVNREFLLRVTSGIPGDRGFHPGLNDRNPREIDYDGNFQLDVSWLEVWACLIWCLVLRRHGDFHLRIKKCNKVIILGQTKNIQHFQKKNSDL